MSRTVTALYDTRAEAEAARQRLASEVELGSARILDQQSHAAGGADGSLNRVPLSHEDRSAFHEGIRRGGFLLTAEVTSHEDADKIVRLLEEGPSVDLDRRQEQWRSDGWTPPQPKQKPASQPAARSAGSGSEQVIPVVEEELVVGRREVDRGGARVRSYVRDVPVHEQVTLREEHINVERRPLDRPVSPEELEGDLLRERNVEVTAKGEEATVSKEARVKEEIVVSKTQERRVEQVEDTVAKTQVEVDQGAGNRPAMGALGAGGSGPRHDTPPPSFGNDRPRPVPELNPAADIDRPQTATPFPIGGATAVPQPRVVHRESVVEAPRSFTPPRETVVTQRRTSSRPSTALVIGSAVIGAIAAGVIPFMLAGRKKETKREVLLIEDHSPSAHVTTSMGDHSSRGRLY